MSFLGMLCARVLARICSLLWRALQPDCILAHAGSLAFDIVASALDDISQEKIDEELSYRCVLSARLALCSSSSFSRPIAPAVASVRSIPTCGSRYSQPDAAIWFSLTARQPAAARLWVWVWVTQ